MPAVERAYLELFRGEATCMPRCNVELPTQLPGKTYAMGITAGGSSTNGYLTVRLQSASAATTGRSTVKPMPPVPNVHSANVTARPPSAQSCAERRSPSRDAEARSC